MSMKCDKQRNRMFARNCAAKTSGDIRGSVEAADCVYVPRLPGDLLRRAAVGVSGGRGCLCGCCCCAVGAAGFAYFGSDTAGC